MEKICRHMVELLFLPISVERRRRGADVRGWIFRPMPAHHLRDESALRRVKRPKKLDMPHTTL